MMVAALLFVIACFGAAFAFVVYRADPGRLDNRLFACIGSTDAFTAALRGLYVFQGYSLSDVPVIRANVLTQATISVFVIEFVFSFPFSRPLPGWARALNLLAALAVVPFVFGPPDALTWVSVAYFLPAFLVTAFFLGRNYRGARGADATAVRLVMLALGLRWVIAQFTYDLARGLGPEVFRAALTAEATAAVLASQMLIGYAVVCGHLFRVRGFLAEVVLVGTYAVAVGTATVAAIEAALTWAPGPTALRVGLLGAALLPVGLVALWRRFRGTVELAVLGPLDPRRAEREACLDEYARMAERTTTPGLLALAAHTLRQITQGGAGQVLAAPGRLLDGADEVLDEALLPALAPPEVNWVHQGSLAGLPPATAAAFRAAGYSLAVPVRTEGELAAALVCTGGQVDRDSVVTAVTLARHVGLRLENDSLASQLEESRRLAVLGSFAAAIAHDIRTPLTSVQMNVQILRGKAKLPPDDMEHFDIALDELRRLNTHISELLDYAKPIKLAPVRCEARELTEEAARTIGPQLAEREIHLAVENEDTPPVLADGPRMRQVLLNLIDNAARASARGSAVTLRTASTADGRVALEVQDRGRGIEVAELGRIFEPFYTTRPDGTGLGLAIVQKLVRAHQGEITVRSTPGQGATFTVILPRAGHVS